MLEFLAFLHIFTDCCVELVNFYEIPHANFRTPILRTNIINDSSNQLIFRSTSISKSRICSACSAQILNLDLILPINPNFDPSLSTFTKMKYSPKFRIFVYSHSTRDETLNRAIAQTMNTISSPQNILVQIRNSPKLIVISVNSLTASNLIELCNTFTCNAVALHGSLITSELSQDLSGENVYIQNSGGHKGNFGGTRARRLISQYLYHHCSDSTSAYDTEHNVFLSLTMDFCIILHFALKTNVTLCQPVPGKEGNCGYILNIKIDDISEKELHKFEIHPYAQKHDGLFYSTFVNKSDLVLDLILGKPFSKPVWITFLISGVVLSAVLCILLNEDWTYLASIVFFIFSISLGQTNTIFENKLRRKITLGSVVIATWSAMMVVLTYSYTNLIYSILMSEVKPDLPGNLQSLLKLVTSICTLFRMSSLLIFGSLWKIYFIK